MQHDNHKAARRGFLKTAAGSGLAALGGGHCGPGLGQRRVIGLGGGGGRQQDCEQAR